MGQGLRNRFWPGERVIVGDDIHGIVERVIFCRDMTVPLYLVEWWDRGEHRFREFNENDLTEDCDGALS